MISKEGQTRVYGFVQLIVLEYSVDIFDFRYFRIFDICDIFRFGIFDISSIQTCASVYRCCARVCVHVHGYVYVIHPEPTARRKKVMGATVCCSFIVH